MNRNKEILKAILLSKKKYNHTCVVTGLGREHGMEIDGAHLVPRDYRTDIGLGLALASSADNIVPMVREAHICFDRLKLSRKLIFLLHIRNSAVKKQVKSLIRAIKNILDGRKL